MPTYISLIRLTDQGIRNIKDGPSRVEAATRAVEAAGGKLSAVYLTMGRYDYVAISEFPDDATAATFALGLGAQGNVRTETLKAFSAEEFRNIVGRIPG